MTVEKYSRVTSNTYTAPFKNVSYFSDYHVLHSTSASQYIIILQPLLFLTCFSLSSKLKLLYSTSFNFFNLPIFRWTSSFKLIHLRYIYIFWISLPSTFIHPLRPLKILKNPGSKNFPFINLFSYILIPDSVYVAQTRSPLLKHFILNVSILLLPLGLSNHDSEP